jgi:hypothetical protein
VLAVSMLFGIASGLLVSKVVLEQGACPNNPANSFENNLGNVSVACDARLAMYLNDMLYVHT